MRLASQYVPFLFSRSGSVHLCMHLNLSSYQPVVMYKIKLSNASATQPALLHFSCDYARTRQAN
jgi:hypothetical protein